MAIFLHGKIESSQGEIKERVNHIIGEMVLWLQDAKLKSGLQNGHYHTTVAEAIMLLEGELEAYWRENGEFKMKSLLGRGDIIVFLPKEPHILNVLTEEARVIAVKFPYIPDFDPGSKVDLQVSETEGDNGIPSNGGEI